MTLFETILLYGSLITGVAFAVIFLTFLTLIILRPILFKIALRNAQRRLLQSLLIIFGLAISTAVIGVSVNLGNTIYTSIRQSVFDEIATTDLRVTAMPNTPFYDADSGMEVGSFSPAQLSYLQNLRNADANVDGALPAYVMPDLSVINERPFRAATVELYGYDADQLDGFGPTNNSAGQAIDLTALSGSDVVLSANLGDLLQAEVGDQIDAIASGGERRQLNVAHIAEIGGLAGASSRILINVDGLYETFPEVASGAINRYEVSVVGGVLPAMETLDAIEMALLGEPVLNDATPLLLSTAGRAFFTDPRQEEGLAASGAGTVNLDGGITLLQALMDDNIDAIINNSDREVITTLESYAESAGRTDLIAATSVTINDIKQDGVALADQVGSVVSLLFTFFGSFSIASGTFLIILIFVLLSASRKQEIGISRAIGMKTSEVIRLYIYEGLVYAVPASIVGILIGIGGAFALVEIVIGSVETTLPSDQDIVTFDVSLTGLLLSFFAGILLTFVTLFITSIFTSRLNIVVAIRDLSPELVEGDSLVSSYLRTIGGPVLFLLSAVRQGRVGRIMTAVLHLLSIVVAAFALAGFSAMETSDRGDVLWVAVIVLPLLWMIRGAGTGIPLTWVGAVAFLFSRFGTAQVPYDWTLVAFAGLLLGLFWIVFFHVRKLVARTNWWITDLVGFGVCMVLMYLILAPTAQLVWLVTDDPVQPPGIAFFILGSLILVGAGVLAITFISDYISRLLSLVLGILPGVSVVVRLAIAYTFSSKVRVGLTLMTFSLVIFSMIVFAVFSRAGEVDTSNVEAVTGGIDIAADSGFIEGGIEARITASERLDINDFERISQQFDVRVGAAYMGEGAAGSSTGEIALRVFSEDWFTDNSLDLGLWDSTYGTTVEELWAMVGSSSDNLAVISFETIDSDVGEGGFGPPPADDGIEMPFTIPIAAFGDDPFNNATWPTVRLMSAGEELEIQVVGVLNINTTAPESNGSIYVNTALANQLTPGTTVDDEGEGSQSVYNITLADGVNVVDTLAVLEAEFVDVGFSGTSLAAEIESFNEQNQAFNNLFQGFMAIGLIAGTIGLGVVAFRSVVERRRSIGVARAVGVQSRAIGLQFLLESFIVALTSSVLGVGLGLLLTSRIFDDAFNSTPGASIDFIIPWTLIGVVVAIVVASSILITVGVAIQAARIKPSETLRFE